MSAFSGSRADRAESGAPFTRRELRVVKRAEAEARNRAANAQPYECGHVHGEAQAGRCAS